MIENRHIPGYFRKGKRILVTGGSGFIGTNLAARMLDKKFDVLSIDEKEPQDVKHATVFKKIDILDAEALAKVFAEFSPSDVVHLAARTGLNGKALADYSANTIGVANLLLAISKQSSVKRCIFTSSKLVCRTGYTPRHDKDYQPDTLYGESKVEGEKIVRSSESLRCDWCIVRPSSIWGPWFGVPYRGFFLTVAKGLYFHPGKVNPPKSFGYVGNVVYQIEKLLEAPRDVVQGRVFYLSDYDEFTIWKWADTISLKIGNKKVKTLPESLVKLVALSGDMLKKIGVKNPSLTTFRLKNMRADTTGIPLEPIKELTGPLPYTMEQGVDQTITWLKDQKLV